jgi:hypothetical protein
MIKTIKAHMRMEEEYEGLSLIFGCNQALKEKILAAIESAKDATDKKPFIFEKISKDRPDIQSIYVEFRDGFHHEAGDFFEQVLRKLNITCEEDTI